MSTRPQWYQDEPGGRFSLPPLTAWSGAAQLIVLLVAVFILELTPLGVSDWLSLHYPGIWNPLHWYQFLTYSLIHDETSFWHLAGNCLVLFFFGMQIEVDLGGKRPFFVFCAVAAVVSSLTFVLIEALRTPHGEVVLLGASGVAYACLVGFATIRPHSQIIFLIIPVRAWALASILMGLFLYQAIMSPGNGVAHMAHFGGGAFGFAYFRYRPALDGLLWRFRDRRNAHLQKRQVDQRQEVDRILAKISKEGISSLSRTERRFLESASKDLRDGR